MDQTPMSLWKSITVALLAVLAGACATAPKPVAVEAPRAAVSGNLVLDGVPERSIGLGERLARYQNTRPADLLGWLADDSGILVSLRFGDVPQLARINQPDGMRTQLTFFDEPVVEAWISPNPAVNGAIFAKDVGGNEYYQLHFLSFADGRTRMLTDGKSRNESVVVAADGRHFAYSSTARNSRDFDIWVGDMTDIEPHRLVLKEGGSWYPLDFSPDGSQLLVQQRFSISDARIFVLDIGTGQLRRLQVGGDTSFDGDARFDRDGRNVFVISDALGESVGLVRIEMDTGVVVPLFTRDIWGIEGIDLSADGRYLAVLRNVDASSTVKIYDRHNSMQEISSVVLDQGVIPRALFNRAGTEIGFTVSGPQVPGDVFSRTLNSGTLTRWTHGETGGIDPNQFVMPRIIRYGAFDTDPDKMNTPRQIPAHVYTPVGDGPFPVLIMIHGGPESQARPRFSEFIQYLVRERGVAVVVPNVRGSSGYGKIYLAPDNGRKREDSVLDIGALIGWIGTQGEFDAKRVAVYVGSYGGYMVLASMVRYSEFLRAGVDIVGISNFVTFLENTNPYRVDQRRPEYGDERDPEMRQFLHDISPLTQAHQIRRPLFVIQGANDPRVPRSEAEQILEAVRENGETAWFMLALDEGHGFRKKSNRDRMTEAVIQFLDQHLLPTAP